MPVKRDKSEDPALTADFWEATLHGGSGRYGFNLERRASLAATTLFALAFGVSGDELRRLLGVWSYCLGFRREGMSVLGIAFQAARSMPRRRRIMLSGPAFNELMSLVFLWPLQLRSSVGGAPLDSMDRIPIPHDHPRDSKLTEFVRIHR